MGDPKFRETYGNMLSFDYISPPWKVMDILRWHTLPIRAMRHGRSHAVGLRHRGEHLIKAKCPPNHDMVSDAVDAVIAGKFGPGGIYKDSALFKRIYKSDFGDRYLADAVEYSGEVIECARAICTYIHETHGRFPPHCEAIHAPGIWLQAHHVEQEYYDRFFANGLTDRQRIHDKEWHAR